MVGAAARLSSRSVLNPGFVTVRIGVRLHGNGTVTAPVVFSVSPGWLYGGHAVIDWGDGSEPDITGDLSVEHEFLFSEREIEIVVSGLIRRFGHPSTPVVAPLDRGFDTGFEVTHVSVEDDSPDGLLEFGGFQLRDMAPQEMTVSLPHRMTAVGDKAFFEQTRLGSIRLPSSVVSIGNSAFYNCTGLASVTIPPRVSTVGVSSFSGCMSLQTVSVPGSVVSIGEWAFSGCSGLFEVRLHDGLETIGSEAFRGCGSLSELDVPSTCSSVGSGFLRGTGLHHRGGQLTLRSPAMVPYVEPFDGTAVFDFNRVLLVPPDPDLMESYMLSGWGNLFVVMGLDETA